MFHKIIDRSFGRWKENRLAHHWCPELPKSVFLERFENVEADRHFIYGLTDSDDVALPMTCRFGRDQYSHVCSVGDESGLIMLFNTEKGAKGPLFNEWQAHSNAVFDMAWLDSDSKMLTASGDQTVVLWDLKTQAAVTSFRGHCCSVRSVAPSPTVPAVLATGSRDGHIMLWDCRNNKKGGQYHTPVKSIQFAHCLLRPGDRAKDVKTLRRKSRCEGPPLDTQQSVTSVLFQSENLLLSSGAVDGCVKVWDMRKTYSSTSRLPMPLHTFDYAGSSHIQRRKGIISLELDVWGSRVFANCTDSTVYCFDIVRYSKEPVCQYVGHRSDTFFSRMSVSPDGMYLLSGSSNSGAYIWKIDKPEESPVRLVGHRDDVSAVAWCPKDITRLVTVGDDSTFRIWRLSQRELGEKDIMVCGQAEISALGMQALTSYSPSLLGDKCTSHVEFESLAKSPRKRPADQKQHFSALSQDQFEINFIKKSKDTQSLSICKRPGEVILCQNSSPAAASTRISVTHSPSKLLRLSPSPRKAEVENSPTKQQCVKLAYDAVTEKLSPSKCDIILDKDEARERLAKRPCLINLSNNSPGKEGVPFMSPARISPSCREEQIIVPKPSFLNSPTVNLPNHVLDAPQEKSNAANTDLFVSSLKTDWLTSYRLSLPHIPVSKGDNFRSGAVSPSTPKRRAFPHSSERTSISTPKRKLGATVGIDETNTCTTPKIPKVTSPRMPRSSGKGGNLRKEAAIPGTHGRTNNLPSARMSIKHFFQ